MPKHEERSCPRCFAALTFQTCSMCGFAPQTKIQVLSLNTSSGARTAEALKTITDLADWSYAAGVSPPSRYVLTQAKRLVLAVGALAPSGPQRMLITSSMKGGVVLTFFLHDGSDATVACMNTGYVLLVLGQGKAGGQQVLNLSYPEALERTQELLHRDIAA